MHTFIKYGLSIRHYRNVLIFCLLGLVFSTEVSAALVQLTEVPPFSVDIETVPTAPQTALVIGNSQYEVGELSHSVSNAAGIATALADNGFKVFLKTDLTRLQMYDALREFKNYLVVNKGVGLFYFSGYGTQAKGENYLLPIDNAHIKDEAYITHEAISVTHVLEEMQQAHNELNIIMLDAAPNTPYLNSRYKSSQYGLADVKVPAGNAIIGYATQPGLTTYHSGLYTRHLIKAIRIGKRITDVLIQANKGVKRDSDGKQIPGYQSSLKEPYCFGGCITQHALVVGINQYQHAGKDNFDNLEGAVNDAIVIRDALRQIKVRLPDERVLLDNHATRAAFLNAWQNMVKKAKPGDTLIVTFSGIGGQQTDTAPFDEVDGKDETLLFHDFDSEQPFQGRITDDELHGIFQEAKDYNILFIVDTNHSGGMISTIPNNVTIITAVNSDRFPVHETIINGKPHGALSWFFAQALLTNSDRLIVPETIINGKPHGALSWFFAQALMGNKVSTDKADDNQDGRLERRELNRFLQENVKKYMKGKQQPKLWPRADSKTVLILP